MKITPSNVLLGLATIAAAASIGLGAAGPDGAGLIGGVVTAVLAVAGVVAASARWGTLAGALVAGGAGLYLFWLKVRPTDGPSICKVNEVIDCESINDSAYAVLFAGTPIETAVSLLGVAFWSGLAIASLAAPAKAPRLYQVSALFALFNIAITLYLGSIMFIERKVCLFCVLMYASNLLILWAAFRGMRETGRGLFDDVPGLLKARSLWTIAGSFVAIVVAGNLLFPAGGRSAPPAGPAADGTAAIPAVDAARYYTEISVPVELHGAEPGKGAAEPTYILVEFADYACPHCREGTLELQRLVDKHPDVRVLFKAFPLDKECNPAFPPEAASRFPQRCIPAYYAECARQQGRFWEVASDIFRNQDMLARAGFPVEDLDLVAKNRGVDMDAFQACVRDPETRRMVLMDGLSGARAGVEGTPAFFLKGIRDDGGWVQLTPKRGFDDLFIPIAADRARRAAQAPAAPADPSPAAPAPAEPGTGG